MWSSGLLGRRPQQVAKAKANECNLFVGSSSSLLSVLQSLAAIVVALRFPAKLMDMLKPGEAYLMNFPLHRFISLRIFPLHGFISLRIQISLLDYFHTNSNYLQIIKFGRVVINLFAHLQW
jgi:hypothetical protein